MKWCNSNWIIGQPWGTAHPNSGQIWYNTENSVSINNDGELVLDVINTPKYFEELKQEKKFDCGCISSVDTYTYGCFSFDYILPKGVNLWPAIWLSGAESWPPEIDIMEGWTGRGIIPGFPNYQRYLIFNKIHPGIIYKEAEEVKGEGHGSFLFDDLTYKWYHSDGVNNCVLVWTPYVICVYYNRYKVMEILDPTILSKFNSPMYICFDLFVTDKFTSNNYVDYIKSGSPFKIIRYNYARSF